MFLLSTNFTEQSAMSLLCFVYLMFLYCSDVPVWNRKPRIYNEIKIVIDP